MAEKPERREGRRYRMDLITHVTAKSAGGEPFSEKTTLRNMSGGGVNFVTCCAERYFQGQQLDIKIDLPGTIELKASLQGSATVFRIDRLPASDPHQSDQKYTVAVGIAAPLQLIRKDAVIRKAKPSGEFE